ncbi:hypothetical protein HYE54_03535 [Aggregatibacter actinomycetemcomitans]|uniref:hypothetical protein n=1 Tax=Aggregatibacter actinomycetemcomitans TaxID=714 RepID=UPI00197C8CBF|nr:hypothetical protein [Aggregatibacter actinomycetemcomitans]MBN6067857.1 hypothetical protein [Aggregatibacter actinomycetemcomitans]MBN6085794.1 hypothetical protein [Aggregatibacter actinomycetemcomitans]
MEKEITDKERLDFIENHWFNCDGESVEFAFNEMWFEEGKNLRDVIDKQIKDTLMED